MSRSHNMTSSSFKSRSAMRRRSLTNSRPCEDIPLRREYMDAHPVCESCRLFRRQPNAACDPHHAFGGRRGRRDGVGNLLAMCRECHEWMEQNKNDGRLVFLLLKDRNGELDVDVVYQASGKHLEWWIECYVPQTQHGLSAQAELRAKHGVFST